MKMHSMTNFVVNEALYDDTVKAYECCNEHKSPQAFVFTFLQVLIMQVSAYPQNCIPDFVSPIICE